MQAGSKMDRSPALSRLGRLAKAVILAGAFLASGAGVSSHAASLYGNAPSIYTLETAPKKAPGFKRGKLVPFSSSQKPGTIIIDTKKNVLHYVLTPTTAVRYRVATAKKGFEWAGAHKVSSKAKWPDWRPPVEMLERKPELPTFMEGGPENPLGARAMYLGSSIYRIHGTNEPKSIGKAASSGCIRMLNEDVSELYTHVKVGALVVVL
jgi:lipoprotein-anchoring transpeptidase ErfK/SrfK